MRHMNTPTCKRTRRAVQRLCWASMTVSCWLITFSHAEESDGVAPVEASVDAACYAMLNRPGQEIGARQACEDALSDAAADTGPSAKLREARLYSAMAMLRAQRNDLPAARADMNRALALAGNDDIVLGNQGSLLLREGAYRNALDTFNAVLARLLEQAPDSTLQAPLYLNRSLALRALGRYDEASKDYRLYLMLSGAEAPPAEELPPPAPAAEPLMPPPATSDAQ